MIAMLDDADMTDEVPPPRVADLPALGRWRPEPWVRLAACRGRSTDLFFPARGEAISQAEALCVGCAVRKPCLDYALDHGIHHGIWGGLSERARRRIRRKRRA